MIKLYGYYPSGNSYKIELLLSQLGIAYDFIHLDLLKGETRTKAFLEKNPNARIPVVAVEGEYLAESHAILWYFGENTRFVPDSQMERGKMLQWMCFEQYHVEPNIGTARYHLTIRGTAPENIGLMLQERQKDARRALNILNKHLDGRPYMVSKRYTLADISLFAYTHVAEEAGISLAPYGQIRAWLDRIRAQPGFIPMTTLQDLEKQPLAEV
ncbi:MAG: glutathione S-transferase family protein [Acidobacteriota bacterium]|nr:glutathione S-transferase family protein [Acidobacteriota bacterium]